MLKRKAFPIRKGFSFLTLFPHSEERVGKRSNAGVSYRH
jgi:hypothetical protein